MTIDWTLLQLADSAFPAGSLAHSAGLEAAWQAGAVRDADDLPDLLRAALASTARSAVPFAAAACRRPDRVMELDAACDALLAGNAVARRASRAQGQAWLATAATVFADTPLPALRRAVRAAASPAHWAPMFGATCAALGVGPPAVAELLLFVAARGQVSAAVRLGIVGPLQAQSIQHALAPHATALARRHADDDPADASHSAPLLDLLHAGHDRLYSRLFVS